MILFVNACVRAESRTKRLAYKLLEVMDEPFTELRLDEIDFPAVDESFLVKRDRLIEAGQFDDPMFGLARQFAEADKIVIAAPYWDLSFPAILKQYIEQINVVGITFEYTPEGTPVGLCKADQLVYITTAGGLYVSEDFGFGYIKALAENFYGIKGVDFAEAAGLDIEGADTEQILLDCEMRIERDF